VRTGCGLCAAPKHPEDHFFKIEVTQKSDDDQDLEPEDSRLYCPYCGHGANLWDFAPEQHARLMAAATAAAEQYAASMLDEMLGKAFGGRSRSSSRRSGISTEFKPGNPPRRRSLPEPGEVKETRRTMQCQACEEVVNVYGLAIYCPNCGLLAPAQQFGELVRMHRDGLAALDALPQEVKRGLTEAGVIGANYENTIKDGFGALETFLKARFQADAPDVSLQGKGNVFQRLGDAADLYREHLGVDLPACSGRTVGNT
jgi:Zn finger protein HypA/HybF involved in hydrogenase expression